MEDTTPPPLPAVPILLTDLPPLPLPPVFPLLSPVVFHDLFFAPPPPKHIESNASVLYPFCPVPFPPFPTLILYVPAGIVIFVPYNTAPPPPPPPISPPPPPPPPTIKTSQL